MTLRYVEVASDGALQHAALLDQRVCECCQTSATMTANGPIVVYRDRSPDEVRDIAIVRRIDGQWTDPVPVWSDGWEMPGCPVNGPSVAAVGEQVSVAWFTAAGKRARVLMARSTDAGATFAEPITIDDANPFGRVDVAMLGDGTTFVCWLASSGAIRLLRVPSDGSEAAAATVAESGTSRRNGFPQMVRAGDELVFAWTDRGVRTAAVSLRPDLRK